MRNLIRCQGGENVKSGESLKTDLEDCCENWTQQADREAQGGGPVQSLTKVWSR